MCDILRVNQLACPSNTGGKTFESHDRRVTCNHLMPIQLQYNPHLTMVNYGYIYISTINPSAVKKPD